MRITELEGASTGDHVTITGLVFINPLHMGDHLEIQGHNFGYSKGAQRVRFDNVEITEFRIGSSDTRLIVTVPTFTDIPEGGRPVTLTVANGVTSDTRSLTITPANTPVSGNLVDVVWE